MPIWQDQKTTVIGHQFQAVILVTESPADPPIPGRALPGRRGKAQQGHPLLVPEGDIPEGFANLGQRPEVMMCLHQCLITLFFESFNGADEDIFQAQSCCLG